MVAATSSHPCAGGPKGLARVTSSRWDEQLLDRLGVSLDEVPPALGEIAR